MKSLAQRRAAAPILFAMLAFGGYCAAASPAVDAARAALVLEEQLDGKCQILSEGGKLVVLRNTDPDQAVRYRLVRMFLGVPQSRIDGRIGPGEAPQKLGCNRVNGRRQSWRVERAAFAPPDNESTP